MIHRYFLAFTYHPALWAPLLHRRRGIEILYLLNIGILIYLITEKKEIPFSDK